MKQSNMTLLQRQQASMKGLTTKAAVLMRYDDTFKVALMSSKLVVTYVIV